MGNHYQFVNFENSILTVKVNPNDNSQNHLYIHIENDELHVACTCGMPDDKLCYHAFIGLYSMCWLTEGFDFQEIYWPGFYDSMNTKKFLDIKLGKERINMSGKPEFGTIYRSRIAFPNDAPPALTESTDLLRTIKPGDTAVYAYALCFATGSFRNRHFPLLLPFLGVTSKDGSKMVSFIKFNLPDKQPAELNDHSHRHQLNELSKTMYNIVRPLSTAEIRNKTTWKEAKQTICELWKQALPILADYPYNQSYHLYWLKYLRERPMKMFMRDCRYSLERPSLAFQLTYHKDYFNLSVNVLVGSQAISIDHKPHLFVFDDQTHTCFLMNSIQDDELLIWMMNNQNKITVIKEHFREFDKNFLGQLNDHYTVFFSDRSGKQFGYDYNLIKTEVGL
jgi:hypothetical protein